MAPTTHLGAAAPGLAVHDGPHDRDRAELGPMAVAAAPPRVDAPQTGCDGEGRGGDQDSRRSDCGAGDADREGDTTLIAKAASPASS